MTDRQHLSDRMPAVAAGQGRWSRGEEEHLSRCADCAAEWQLVREAAALGTSVEAKLVPERVAQGVAEALRARSTDVPGWQRVRRLIPLAAAAAVLLAVWGGRHLIGGRAAAEDLTVLLPEIQYLDPAGLDAVLDLLPAPPVWSPIGDWEGMDDLGEEALEHILRNLEG
jgi:anti-sigma factor RsiW